MSPDLAPSKISSYRLVDRSSSCPFPVEAVGERRGPRFVRIDGPDGRRSDRVLVDAVNSRPASPVPERMETMFTEALED